MGAGFGNRQKPMFNFCRYLQLACTSGKTCQKQHLSNFLTEVQMEIGSRIFEKKGMVGIQEGEFLVIT